MPWHDSTCETNRFHGIGYTGYDNYKKKYVSTWMDNLGTMIMMSVGTFDAAGKVLTSKALMDDPSTGKPMTMTEKLTVVSNDELLMERWGSAPDGKEFRMMELRYTRKK